MQDQVADLPMRRFHRLGGWILALLFCSLGFEPAPAEARQLELHAAVEAGQVSARIEFLGGAMGDRMKVYLRKRTADELYLSVAPGTIFVPQGGDVQRLAAVQLKGKLTAQGTYQRAPVIKLNDANEHGYLIEVVCIDYHKNSPPPGQSFGIGPVDLRCQRILSIRGDVSLWAYQSAIWMDRAGVSTEKLQGSFKVSAADLQAARGLLVQAEQVGAASLDTVEVSAEAKVSARGMFSADPATRAQAHTQVELLDAAEREKLMVLLKLNVPGGGRLPTAEELQAGSTLESLLPVGIVLPKLEIPESVDEILAMVESMRQYAETVGPDARREEIARRVVASLKLVPQLAALQARLPIVRIAAAQAIANVKDPVAVEALLVALRDGDARVRAAAVAGLQKLTEQKLGDDAQAWETWWQNAHSRFAEP